jgi:hypothetical protein
MEKWVTHIEGSDGSSRIPRNQLHLHTEVAEQVRTLGLETSTFSKSNTKMKEEKIIKNSQDETCASI